MMIILIGVVAFLLFELQVVVYRKNWSKKLKVTLRFKEPVVYEGDMAALEEVVENRKRLPLPALKVKFQVSRHLLFEKGINAAVTDYYYRNDVFTAMPYQKITRELPFQCSKRGYYDIHGIDVIGTDLFMVSNLIEERDSHTSMYVFPRPCRTEEFMEVLRRISGEVLTKRHLLEDPFEYNGIREYQVYDSIRSINWKATAKSGALMVNQKNYTALKSVRIFLNLDDHSILRREELLEYSISMAAALLMEFLGNGIQVSLYSNTQDAITGEKLAIEASAGKNHLETVMKGLARINLDKPAFSYGDAFLQDMLAEDSGIMTILISPNLYEEFQQVLLKYREKDKEFVWLCPGYEAKEEQIETELRQNWKPIIYKKGMN